MYRVQMLTRDGSEGMFVFYCSLAECVQTVVDNMDTPDAPRRVATRPLYFGARIEWREKWED